VHTQLTARLFPPGRLIHRRGQPISQVYFPARSIISLTNTTEDGAACQLAMIGSEGMTGIQVAFGSRTAMCDAPAHRSHEVVGYTMTADAFRRELDERGPLYTIAQHYAAALINSLAQSVACNARHSVEARCTDVGHAVSAFGGITITFALRFVPMITPVVRTNRGELRREKYCFRKSVTKTFAQAPCRSLLQNRHQ
jgi:CRP-like cAMP-binding protein